MDRDELAAWLRLTLTPGVGNEAARRLLAALRPAARASSPQPAAALRQVVERRPGAALLQAPAGVAGAASTPRCDWLRGRDAGATAQV